MQLPVKAWRIQRYGAPERLTQITQPMPVPGTNEILIRVRASAVTRADGMMRAGVPRFARLFLGLGRPRNNLSGTCMAGEVLAVGSAVSRFNKGDQVFGEAGLNFGANATHICLDESGVLVQKPEFLSYEQAAVICDGPLTSYNFLRDIARLKAGEKILILGGSGSLGSAAVQIALALGADVTATCSSGNLALVAGLGAQQVIDYTKEDFTKLAPRYDVIYDTLGVSSFKRARLVLTGNGRYICPVLSGKLLCDVLLTARSKGRKARFSATGILKPAHLRQMIGDLMAMVKEKQLVPLMDRSYALDQLVEAHIYMETGRKLGNVVVL